jgi:hypothetical protein
MSRFLAGVAFAFTMSAASLPAPAAHGGERLADVVLDEQRGGLRTPDGLEFGFGAVVRTFVDGALALETQVTWGELGAVQSVEKGAPDGLAAASLPDGAAGWTGLVLPGDGGVTTVLQKLDGGAVRNVILNTANNRQIRQETEVTLNVPALDQLQRDALAAQIGLRLDAAVASALGEAAR